MDFFFQELGFAGVQLWARGVKTAFRGDISSWSRPEATEQEPGFHLQCWGRPAGEGERRGKGELMWASQGAHLSPRLAGGIQTPGGAALPLVLPHPQPQAWARPSASLGCLFPLLSEPAPPCRVLSHHHTSSPASSLAPGAALQSLPPQPQFFL